MVGEQVLAGQVAVVTGAGRGIGRAVAEHLAALGATVVLAARSAEQLAETAQAILAAGGQAVAVPGDLTDDAFVESLFSLVRERFGQLDILVNNAGVAPFGKVEDLPVDRLREALAVNVVAVFACTQQAVRMMLADHRPGKIINIGSVRSHWTEAGDSGAYNASKYAVRGLTESIARQLHGTGCGIAIGLVCPGVVDTPLTNPSGDARPTWLRPETVAAAVVHAVTAPADVNVFDVTVFPTEQRPF